MSACDTANASITAVFEATSNGDRVVFGTDSTGAPAVFYYDNEAARPRFVQLPVLGDATPAVGTDLGVLAPFGLGYAECPIHNWTRDNTRFSYGPLNMVVTDKAVDISDYVPMPTLKTTDVMLATSTTNAESYSLLCVFAVDLMDWCVFYTNDDIGAQSFELVGLDVGRILNMRNSGCVFSWRGHQYTFNSGGIGIMSIGEPTVTMDGNVQLEVYTAIDLTFDYVVDAHGEPSLVRVSRN